MKLKFPKFKKKKEIAELGDPVPLKDRTPKHSIHELDYAAADAQHDVQSTSTEPVPLIPTTEEETNEDYQFSSESVGGLTLSSATETAKKYLISHELLPNNIEPMKAMKKDAGGYYFEFKDKGMIYSISLSEEGEVVEWEKRER
ncbi:hypothetical protein ACFLQI_02085 [Candidatus Undinarchaeota archaeon]